VTNAVAPTVLRTKRKLSFLVHADSKVGKSTLAATAPLPIIALDAEGGWSFMANSPTLTAMYGQPLILIEWDPCAGPPPRYDGSWHICVAVIQTWQALQCAYDWLVSGQHDFKSLVVDSITEIQRRCKMNIVAPTQQMQMQHWGALLTLMDTVIRGLRDLKDNPYNSLEVVVFIAETRTENGRWTPYMQGQISVALPYWMDVVGYLFVEQVMDDNGMPTGKVRRLLIGPNPMYVTGERVQGMLPDVIDDPNITRIVATVYPQQGA
jgi:AAA domain